MQPKTAKSIHTGEEDSMLTIKEMTDGVTDIGEMELAKISDKLWEIGNLEEIRENVSHNLFYLHIGMNLIGNWKGDGWWYIICEQADLVPYIPETLNQLYLTDLKMAFEDVIKIFPQDTVFKSDDVTYYDICNFLQSASFKVKNKRLKSITKNKRKEMVAQVSQRIERLEELTKPIFGDNAECGGWKPILDFISRNAE